MIKHFRAREKMKLFFREPLVFGRGAYDFLEAGKYGFFELPVREESVRGPKFLWGMEFHPGSERP